MTEQNGFSAFIRKKLAEFGWLQQESKVEAESPSPWDPGKISRWEGLQHHLHQFFKSFVQWIHAHAWWGRTRDGQQAISADELLPGFMETAKARSRVEFDDQRQAWVAHLDYSHRSLTCRLKLVNEETAPIMEQILFPRQFEAPPPE